MIHFIVISIVFYIELPFLYYYFNKSYFSGHIFKYRMSAKSPEDFFLSDSPSSQEAELQAALLSLSQNQQQRWELSCGASHVLSPQLCHGTRGSYMSRHSFKMILLNLCQKNVLEHFSSGDQKIARFTDFVLFVIDTVYLNSLVHFESGWGGHFCKGTFSSG